jgi:hypothetical protein
MNYLVLDPKQILQLLTHLLLRNFYSNRYKALSGCEPSLLLSRIGIRILGVLSNVASAIYHYSHSLKLLELTIILNEILN